MKAVHADLQEQNTCILFATGSDLSSVLKQLDQRTLRGLLEQTTGRSSVALCECPKCKMDIAIDKFSLAVQVQVFSGLVEIAKPLMDLWTDLLIERDQENEDSNGSSSESESSREGVLSVPDWCKTAAWVYELLKADMAASNSIWNQYASSPDVLRNVYDGLFRCVAIAEDGHVDVAQLRNLVDPEISDLPQDINYVLAARHEYVLWNQLRFSEASCCDTFLNGSHQGKSLESVLAELKEEITSLDGLGIYFDVVKANGKVYVLGRQCELWCMKEYMEWLCTQNLPYNSDDFTVEVRVWPLVPSVKFDVKFDNTDTSVLQHFLSVFSTKCDGDTIELVPPTASEVECIQFDSVNSAAVDAKVVRHLLPHIIAAENVVVSDGGRRLVSQMRLKLDEFLAEHGPGNDNNESDVFGSSFPKSSCVHEDDISIFQGAGRTEVDVDVNVIQDVEHIEPAAVRDKEMAALTVRTESDEEFAALVERRLHDKAEPVLDIYQDSIVHDGAVEVEKILLLQVSRNPSKVQQHLLSVDTLEFVRDCLATEGYDVMLPSGTLIFVSPLHYVNVRNTIQQFHKDVKCYHIVVSENLAPLIREALQQAFHSLENIRIRDAHTQVLAYAGYSDDDFYKVLNTFLSTTPALLEAQTVNQSTTEAHGSINPRRHDF